MKMSSESLPVTIFMSRSFAIETCSTCIMSHVVVLETFMGVVQRTGAGSNPRISRVVSKSDRQHGTATTDNRTLGLTPAGTISHSNLSLGLYTIRRGGGGCQLGCQDGHIVAAYLAFLDQKI